MVHGVAWRGVAWNERGERVGVGGDASLLPARRVARALGASARAGVGWYTSVQNKTLFDSNVAPSDSQARPHNDIPPALLVGECSSRLDVLLATDYAETEGEAKERRPTQQQAV